jgi:dTDP-4-amino-4,6-dideoxygalactose transaminase
MTLANGETQTMAVDARLILEPRSDMPSFDDIAVPLRALLRCETMGSLAASVSQFEEAVSAYLGMHVAAVSSGTIGLLFTLQAFGLRAGQRVIVPSFTSAATAQAIRYAGGIPAFAEIDESLTLSPSDLEQMLHRFDNVGAVVPVHAFGRLCKVDEIQSVVDDAARRYGRPIPVVYDAAHAFGAADGGRPAGSFGSAEVFSLSPTGPLIGIEGGLVSSHHVGLIQRVKKMRQYGIDAAGKVYWPGLNGRLSGLHAVIGTASLRDLPRRMDERQRKARRYAECIAEATSCYMPPWPRSQVQTFEELVVVLPSELAESRGYMIEALARRNIMAGAPYSPLLHDQPYFRELADRPLPVTEAVGGRVLSLPFFTSITDAEMHFVAAVLAAAEAAVIRPALRGAGAEASR